MSEFQTHLCAKHRKNPVQKCTLVPHMNVTLKVPSISSADIVVYHSPCVDGHLSAALAHWFACGQNQVLKFHGSSPQDAQDGKVIEKLGTSGITDSQFIVYCDICPRADTLRPMDLVIDHHPLAAKTASQITDRSQVVFNTERSGAALMWEYLTGTDVSNAPEFVRAVDLHDRGKFTEAQALRSEQYYAATSIIADQNENKPCFDCYIELMNNPEPLLNQTAEWVERHKKQVAFFVQMARRVMFYEREAVFVYGADGRYATDIGRALLDVQSDPNKLVIVARYDASKNLTFWSFRSRDGMSAAAAAQILRGNGHGNAAGAETHGPNVFEYLKFI